jgi:hypothetical protein
MVVCKLVRIRNTSSRSFSLVHSGDIWYTPRIAGSYYGGGEFEIPPGFDAEVEDLVIPWAAVSHFFAELIFGAIGTLADVKCVVGPGLEDCCDIDFVRLHAATWEPLLPDLWLPLGHRHLRGVVAPVEVELVFFDPPQQPNASAKAAADDRAQDDASKSSATADSGECSGIEARAFDIAKCMRFEHCLSGAPANTILLNVFDLAAATATINAMLCNSLVKSVGAFHAAVEVYGSEYSFYQSGRGDPDACGICRSAHARQHPHHVYRQSVIMGTTHLSAKEVFDVILGMVSEWPSKRYSLVHCNCIHFCNELLQRLGVGPVPRWVRGLHEIGEAASGPFYTPKDSKPKSSPKALENDDDDDFFWAPAGFTPVQAGCGLGMARAEDAR